MISTTSTPQQNSSYNRMGETLFYAAAIAYGVTGSIILATQTSSSSSTKNNLFGISGMVGLIALSCFGLIKNYCCQQTTETESTNITIPSENEPLLNRNGIGQEVIRLAKLILNNQNPQINSEQQIVDTLIMIHDKLQKDLNQQLENTTLEKDQNSIAANEELSSYEDDDQTPEFLLASYQVQMLHIKSQLEQMNILLKKLNSTGSEEIIRELKEIITDLTREDRLSGSIPRSVNTTPLKAIVPRIPSTANSPTL